MARPNDNPDYGARTLQVDPECKGRDVWELQIKLLGWGSGTDNDGIGNFLDPMKVTGTFDARTRDAVKRFQKALTLDVTGIADSAVFQALDREAALYPVLVHQMKCPCAIGANDGPIVCRCNDHAGTAKCTGFGNAEVQRRIPGDGQEVGGHYQHRG